MRVECCSCGKLLKDGHKADGLISHGLCEACRDKMYDEYGLWEEKEDGHGLSHQEDEGLEAGG